MKTTFRNARRSITLGLVALAMIASSIVTPAALGTSRADAVPWSSRVDLGGRAACSIATDRVTKVELWVRDNDDREERYYRANLDNGRFIRNYSARLSVPGAGVNVWARVTCARTGEYWTNFGVSRPRIGYGTTRHLCAPRTGPCL